MTEEEIKSVIRCIHESWYGDWLDTPQGVLKMHRHMEALFNFAGITESLVENNPSEVSPAEFKRLTGVKE